MIQERFKKASIAIAATAAGSWLASWLYQVIREKTDRKKFPPPGQMVDIGGRQLHVMRAGNKKPTVVILPWLGGLALEWINIQNSLSSHATVYVVDRAGLGWSDPARGPQTPQRIVRDLHALLNALPVTEPVILVGHSYGGLPARLYAARYPERVKALVLMESSHEDQYQEFSRFPGQEAIIWLFKAVKDRAKWLGAQRLRADLGLNKKLVLGAKRKYTEEFGDAGLARHFSFSHRRADAQELVGMTCGRDSVQREAQNHGNLPIMVVTGGAATRKPEEDEIWRTLQKRFLTLSTDTNQVWAPENGHDIHIENPELVAQAIKDLIDQLPESSKHNEPASQS